MQVSLVSMNHYEYLAFIEMAIPAYAQANIDSGRWDVSDALERARNSYNSLLPQGIETQENYIFIIKETISNEKVGHIWVKVEEAVPTKPAFIYDVEIYENYRRKGYGKSALQAIEKYVSTLGAKSLGLHVFSHNSAARALYESAGYRVSGHNMQKII